MAFKAQSIFIDIVAQERFKSILSTCIDDFEAKEALIIIIPKVWRRARKYLIINAMIFTFILIISNGVLINSIQSNEGSETWPGYRNI